MSEPINSAHAGQAVYTDLVLKVYDIWVLGITNSYIWKCPTFKILKHFNQHVSSNHLDIGVGTGYYLDKCNFQSKPRIALMDLNLNSINTAAKRIDRYQLEKYQQNILEPIKAPIKPFDSISINYLLHCLPGTIYEKSTAFDTILPILNDGGVLFGSTVLQGDIQRNFVAKKLMNIYNKKGIFSNQNDTLKGLEESLKKRFNTCGIEVIGCVALFWAKK
jgi:ubiquinone/menaquinone biosynthesis C-methylase UbiE